MNLAAWRKGIIAVLTALAAVGASLPEGAPSWLPAVATIAGAVLVILVPNAPTAGQRAKAALSVEEILRDPGYRPGLRDPDRPAE